MPSEMLNDGLEILPEFRACSAAFCLALNKRQKITVAFSPKKGGLCLTFFAE
jgi:hypothetical protein